MRGPFRAPGAVGIPLVSYPYTTLEGLNGFNTRASLFRFLYHSRRLLCRSSTLAAKLRTPQSFGMEPAQYRALSVGKSSEIRGSDIRGFKSYAKPQSTKRNLKPPRPRPELFPVKALRQPQSTNSIKTTQRLRTPCSTPSKADESPATSLAKQANRVSLGAAAPCRKQGFRASGSEKP